ncbi:MAG: ribonuclease Y [Dehalococcoidia bacterium]|jgi:ribonuclease Y
MPVAIAIILIGILALAVGALVGYNIRLRINQTQIAAAERNAAKILSEAQTRQKEILLEAKEEAIRARAQGEGEIRERRAELQKSEQRLTQKEESLDRKIEALERRTNALSDQEKALDETRQELQGLHQKQLAEIERISGLTSQEAREILLSEVENEVRAEANRRVKLVEAEVKEEGAERARKLLVAVMQRLSTDVTSESTVSVVPIPSDDMKGRIIGREGRNIRALEAATGVDLIIDDTPDAVTLSAFDPVRREIARVALTRLVTDGRIHPTRIEEVVEKARQEVDADIKLAGEQAAVDAGCPGLHPELLKTLGRLRYRTSYGQNQLKHAVECAHVCGMIADEIGADVRVARRAGLLHDIGKALDHDIEGTHALLGADLLRRFGMSPAVVHAVAAHHEEEEPQSVEAVIVQVSDSVSGGRPGARRETLEHYIKRMQSLEAVAHEFKGVEKAFAIQAGREIRIIVKPEEIDDLESMRLARDISRKIEETLEYPGQVKVTVVRETRAVEYAR